MPIQILIAQEDVLLASLLAEKLAACDDLLVIGCVSAAVDVVPAVARLCPDVVLFDLQWTSANGMSLLDRVCALEQKTAVVALGADANEDTQVMAARNGARGYVARTDGAPVIPEAIRRVHSGQVWFMELISDRVFEEYHQLVRRVRDQERPVHRLTDRDRRLLTLLAAGQTNREIAEELVVTVHTVKLYLQKLYQTLGVPNRTEAAVFAVREGIAAPPVEDSDGALRQS